MALMRKWNVAAIAALGVVAFGATAMAADNGAIVKERQDSMKAQAADVKAINDYARGKGDKDAAAKAAADLNEHANKMAKLFPKGTSSADLAGKSHAKPEIWTDNAKFMTIVSTFKDKASKLPALIKTGTPDDVKAAATDLAKTGCVSCHSSYREAGAQ